MKLKLSVIIPVYNVEKYLAQTLDSVINQTYKNLEIICINDGSTDNSRLILDEYSKKEPRMIIVDQKNQGLAAARNTGLKHSTGELVAFLDSDDWLELDFYEKLIDRLIADNSDIAVGETHYIYPDRTDKTNWVNDFTFCKKDKDTIETIEDKQNIIYACACWNKVYRANLIKDNNLQFPPGLFIEDVPFTFVSTILSNKISLVKEAIHNYRQQNNSIMTKSKENRTPFDIFKIYDVCENWLNTVDLTSEIKNEYFKILKNFEIFNIYSWFLGICSKYRQEYFLMMKNKFKTINIIKNPYISPKSIKIYRSVLSSNNSEQFFKKYNTHKISLLKSIFSVRNETNNKNTHKVITILGIKSKFKRTKKN